MLKKILLALIFVITAITNITHAEDDMKTVASKAYVDTKIETKQLKIPAAGQPNVDAGETVMTYTSTGNGQIGERGLYSDISSYNASTDGDKLITASALNATFTNLPTTDTTKLECANSPACTLWTIVDQTAYGDMLPSGYTRLEYIQSTGTQYIDTDFVGTINTDIEIKGSDFTDQAAQLVVTTTTTGGSQLRIAKFTATQKVGAGIGTGAPTYSTSNGVSQFVAKLENHNLYLDGQLVGAVSTDGFNQGDMGNMLIFSGLYGSGRYYGVGKVYYVKIWDNNTLVRNFIPAKRNSDNVIGMYDTVSGAFFTNAATSGDDFTPGPPAN